MHACKHFLYCDFYLQACLVISDFSPLFGAVFKCSKKLGGTGGEMIFPYPRNSPRKLPIFPLFPSSHPPPELNEGRGFHPQFPTGYYF